MNNKNLKYYPFGIANMKKKQVLKIFTRLTANKI